MSYRSLSKGHNKGYRSVCTPDLSVFSLESDGAFFPDNGLESVLISKPGWWLGYFWSWIHVCLRTFALYGCWIRRLLHSSWQEYLIKMVHGVLWRGFVTAPPKDDFIWMVYECLFSTKQFLCEVNNTCKIHKHLKGHQAANFCKQGICSAHTGQFSSLGYSSLRLSNWTWMLFWLKGILLLEHFFIKWKVNPDN